MRIWLDWISNLGASSSNSATRVPNIEVAGDIAVAGDVVE